MMIDLHKTTKIKHFYVNHITGASHSKLGQLNPTGAKQIIY